jgi:hypothetical protein
MTNCEFSAACSAFAGWSVHACPCCTQGAQAEACATKTFASLLEYADSIRNVGVQSQESLWVLPSGMTKILNSIPGFSPRKSYSATIVGTAASATTFHCPFSFANTNSARCGVLTMFPFASAVFLTLRSVASATSPYTAISLN